MKNSDAQTLLVSKNGRQPEKPTNAELDLPSSWTASQPDVDTDGFTESDQKKGLDLRPVWRAIQRNILLVAGITTVVTAAALYSSLKSPRIYQGDFRFLVEPITSEAKSTDPAVLSRNREHATNNSVDYPTLLQVLQSPGLLTKIAQQIQTQYPDVNYDSLRRDLVVQRIGTNLSDSTKLIEVAYQGEDPQKVQFVLQEVAQGYLKYSLEDRKTRIGSGVKFIEDQLPRLQQQVDQMQGAMQAHQERYKLSDPKDEGAQLSEQLREVQAQRLETQRQLQEQKTLYANLQKQIKLAPSEVIAASTLSEDPNYQDLLGQEKKIESQIAVESARFSENSPMIQALREKQKNLSRLLKQQAQQIASSNSSRAAANPRILTFQNSINKELNKQFVDTANQVQVLQVRNQAVTQAEAVLTQQVEQFPAITRRYNDLQRRLDIATNTLNQLLTQRETLRVEAAQKEMPWEIVSEPRIPRDAAGNAIAAPRSTKKLPLAVIGGFLLGLGAAMLRERSRKVFPSSEDTQIETKLSLLGLIPFAKIAQKLSNSSAVTGLIQGGADDSSASLFFEAFHSLYTNIRFLPSNWSVHSLVVGSAAPGDGKTTVALHLAQAAAFMGQRVLVVDANLRSPQLHSRLDLPNLQGLSDLLSHNLPFSDVIQESPLQDNLFVLTSGQDLAGSGRLMASKKMQHLMQQFKSAFDLVIYDTPHLLDFPDANFLAANTDGILMVVGVGKTDRSVVMQVVDKLNAFRLPILGVVVNFVKEGTKSSPSYHNPQHEQPQVQPALLNSKQK